MSQMVRAHEHKLEGPLRKEIINLYQPFKSLPYFLNYFIEGIIKTGKKLSLIIEFEDGFHRAGIEQVNEVLKKHRRSHIKQEFLRVSCCSAEITPQGLEEALSSCHYIRRVYLNREVHALLDVAVPSANAKNIVRNNRLLTGKGVTIAIVDTGIYPHKDLKGRIKMFLDFIKYRKTPYDDNGHGTHCAGNAAGNGEASTSKYMGSAPEANLIGVKVLDKRGTGSVETVMQGIEWCIQNNERNPLDKVDIISMSLGSTPQHYANEDSDPMVKMVEEAWASGIVVCVAAGNDGPDAKTISSPGISDQVITVGALDDKGTVLTRNDDAVAGFSSRGPTNYGVAKPDILVPGVNIISLRSPNSYLDKSLKSNRVGNDYFVLSGTSMATPICAGITALIKQYKPDATPFQVKMLIKKGTVLWKNRDPNTYGAGYMNAGNSIPL